MTAISPEPPEPPAESRQPGDEPVSLAYARRDGEPHARLAAASLWSALLGVAVCVAGVISNDFFWAPIACLLLGPLLGLAGVLLGVLALLRIKRDPVERGGKRMAVAGICTGGIGAVLMLAMLLPAYLRWREDVLTMRSLSNLRSIGFAITVYQLAHSVCPDNLPRLVTDGYLQPLGLRDPCRRDATSTCDYYYTVGLQPDDSPDWIIAYSDPTYRDGEGGCILYLDGTVEWEREPRFSHVLEQFHRAYQQARGIPPTMLVPDPAGSR